MSASAAAAASTDCTVAALGAMERMEDSRLVVGCATFFLYNNNQQPHFHKEPQAAAYARE